jgi:hypothetical protein
VEPGQIPSGPADTGERCLLKPRCRLEEIRRDLVTGGVEPANGTGRPGVLLGCDLIKPKRLDPVSRAAPSLLVQLGELSFDTTMPGLERCFEQTSRFDIVLWHALAIAMQPAKAIRSFAIAQLGGSPVELRCRHEIGRAGRTVFHEHAEPRHGIPHALVSGTRVQALAPTPTSGQAVEDLCRWQPDRGMAEYDQTDRLPLLQQQQIATAQIVRPVEIWCHLVARPMAWQHLEQSLLAAERLDSDAIDDIDGNHAALAHLGIDQIDTGCRHTVI